MKNGCDGADSTGIGKDSSHGIEHEQEPLWNRERRLIARVPDADFAGSED